MTIEDLWELPETPGVRYELADGELIEVPAASAIHSFITALVFELIRDFVRRRRLGLVFPDGLGYILSEDSGRLRIPDVSFVSRERIPTSGLPEGFWPGAPDLAIEIASPHDRAEDVRAKVGEYLDAGTRTVWVLWPRDRAVTVYRSGGHVQELGPDNELNGGDLLPGFRATVADLFAVDTGADAPLA